MISSTLSERVAESTAVYAATKAALNALTRSLALELAPAWIVKSGIDRVIESVGNLWTGLAPPLQTTIVITLQIVAILVPLILTVAYLTYAERKVIGYIQNRIGPNRVGYKGLLQPFADVIKLLVKEIIVPARASKFLFVTALILSIVPALATWAVIPVSPAFVLADINAGVLYVLALTSLGVYGVILAGWA